MHPERIPSQAELLQIFRRAGFREPTPLQERLIPLVLRGRDLAVHAADGSGATAAIAACLMIGMQGEATRPRALLIVAGIAEVADFSRIWARFTRPAREAPPVLLLGETDDVRREQRRLEKGAAVVVGTVERVIDHIRRGSLSFDVLETVFVEAPAASPAGREEPPAAPAAGAASLAAGLTAAEIREDFTRDAQFIFAKFPPRCQTVLFSRSAFGEEDALLALLHRPAFLTPDDLTAGAMEAAGAAGHLSVQVLEGRTPDALARILMGRGMFPALVLHAPRTDGQALAAGLRRRLLRVESISVSAAPASRRKLYASFTNRELDVLLLAFPVGGRLPQADLDELAPPFLVYYDLPAGRPTRESPGRDPSRGPVGAPGTAARRAPAILVLAGAGQEKELGRLQEAIGVTLQSGEAPSRDEVLGGAIKKIVERLRSESDPGELARLRATIRRSVPLFMRSWFTAYLLQAHLPFEPAGEPQPAEKGRQLPGRQPLGRQQAPAALRAAVAPGVRQAPAAPRPERVERPQIGSPQGGSRSVRTCESPTGSRGRRGESQRGEPRREPAARPQQQRQPAGRQQPAAPGVRPSAASDGSRYTQLFVSIGRNRKVFARDLTELFASTLQLTEAEIGDVRVFDKYSFVDVAAERAADAIARLSGTELKGRTITVNYAKKKEEKEGT